MRGRVSSPTGGTRPPQSTAGLLGRSKKLLSECDEIPKKASSPAGLRPGMISGCASSPLAIGWISGAPKCLASAIWLS